MLQATRLLRTAHVVQVYVMSTPDAKTCLPCFSCVPQAHLLVRWAPSSQAKGCNVVRSVTQGPCEEATSASDLLGEHC